MQAIQQKTKKFFDNTFENIEKNIQTQAKQTAQSVTSQFGVKSSSDQGTNEGGGKKQGNGTKAYDEATAEVIEDWYAPSDPAALAALENQPLPKAGEMTPEEQAKYNKLRKQLHDEVYYNKLVERKTVEQEHAEEEQQEEQEQQMEELQLEEKKKQDDDIAIRMQTNKAEQFPGVAG